MTINIAICDDDNTQITYLKTLVHTWASDHNYYIKLDEFSSSEQFLFHYDSKKDYDILLLDIEMGAMNGVELARRIRLDNRRIQIIFVSGYSDYIADGYDVSALHYLMKPINPDKLMETLGRALFRIEHEQKSLYVETNLGNIKVPLHEISHIEVIKNYIHLYAEETYIAKMTLSKVAEQLDTSFLKVGRSYLVNLSYIRKVSKTDIYLSTGTLIPLPRGMFETVNRAIIGS